MGEQIFEFWSAVLLLFFFLQPQALICWHYLCFIRLIHTASLSTVNFCLNPSAKGSALRF